MSLSVNTIVKDALMLVGEVAVTEAPSSEAASLAARMLNDLLLEWSTNELVNPMLRTVTLTSASGVNYITFGSTISGADIVDDIQDIVNFQTTLGSIVYPCVEISYDEYMQKSLKTLPALPQFFACDYQYPEGKIFIHMAPMNSYGLQLTYRPKFPEISAASQSIEIDPIYRQAMVYNLASRLTPFYAPASGMDQTIVYHAKNSLEKLKDRTRIMNRRKARPSTTGGSGNYMGFWTSPLNNVGGR